MTTFELTPAFAPALPLSLLADGNVASSLTRLPEVVLAPRPAAQSGVRLELIASLRLRIANGTYRVSAMELADCMIESIFIA